MAKRETVLTRERAGQPSGKRHIVAKDDDVLPGHNTRGPELDCFIGRRRGLAAHGRDQDQPDGQEREHRDSVNQLGPHRFHLRM